MKFKEDVASFGLQEQKINLKFWQVMQTHLILV